MNERGKSDRPVVPANPPNKATAAEVGEERGRAKGNTDSKPPSGLSAGFEASSALGRVREVARRDKDARFTALLHHVTLFRLREAYWAISPKAAPGVDGVTWAEYGQDLEVNLQDLLGRVQSGRYRATPSRRVYIPKADGRLRPLGIASLEDKIVQRADGDVIVVRFADDTIVGFQYEGDARRFLYELRDRFAKFGLELHPDKTRLIEFGRRAAIDRKRRGLGKPETFDFLGFTHICATSKNGRFWVRRITISKRMRAKLAEVKAEVRRRRYLPIPDQGRWLAAVVRGHQACYAVPGNNDAVNAFRHQVTRHWHQALRRRSQKTRLTWDRMDRIATRWLPQTRILHPFPEARFAAMHPR